MQVGISRPGSQYPQTIGLWRFVDVRLVPLIIGAVFPSKNGQRYQGKEAADAQFRNLRKQINEWISLDFSNTPVDDLVAPSSPKIKARMRLFWKILFGFSGRLYYESFRAGLYHVTDKTPIDNNRRGMEFDVLRGAADVPRSFALLDGESEDQRTRRYFREAIDITIPLLTGRGFFLSGNDIMGICGPSTKVGDIIAVL